MPNAGLRNHPRKSQHIDRRCSAAKQRPCRRLNRRAGRVDVVDEKNGTAGDPRPCRLRYPKRPLHVLLALRQAQSDLAARRPDPLQRQRVVRDGGSPGDSGRKQRRLIELSLPKPPAIHRTGTIKVPSKNRLAPARCIAVAIASATCGRS